MLPFLLLLPTSLDLFIDLWFNCLPHPLTVASRSLQACCPYRICLATFQSILFPCLVLLYNPQLISPPTESSVHAYVRSEFVPVIVVAPVTTDIWYPFPLLDPLFLLLKLYRTSRSLPLTYISNFASRSLGTSPLLWFYLNWELVRATWKTNIILEHVVDWPVMFLGPPQYPGYQPTLFP